MTALDREIRKCNKSFFAVANEIWPTPYNSWYELCQYIWYDNEQALDLKKRRRPLFSLQCQPDIDGQPYIPL